MKDGIWSQIAKATVWAEDAKWLELARNHAHNNRRPEFLPPGTIGIVHYKGGIYTMIAVDSYEIEIIIPETKYRYKLECHRGIAEWN